MNEELIKFIDDQVNGTKEVGKIKEIIECKENWKNGKCDLGEFNLEYKEKEPRYAIEALKEVFGNNHNKFKYIHSSFENEIIYWIEKECKQWMKWFPFLKMDWLLITKKWDLGF
jgi:hypothetical protein